MKPKNRLEYYQKINDVIKNFDSINKTDINKYMEIIFLLLDFLVDGQYTEEEHNSVASKIKEIYKEAKKKYLSNPDFLCFSGIMIFIAEWYFDETIENATVMLKKAMLLDSDNVFYRWAYNTIPDQRPEVNTENKYVLSKQILENENLLKSIEKKGLLGKYIIGIIIATYENTKFWDSRNLCSL